MSQAVSASLNAGSPHPAPGAAAPAALPCLHAHAWLQHDAAEVLTEWRQRFDPRPRPSERALFAIQQILLPAPEGAAALAAGPWRDHVLYHAGRLARLGVPLRLVQEAIEVFHATGAEFLRARHPEAGAGEEAALALLACGPGLGFAVAQAYVTVESGARDALLAVLDAELQSHGLDELLGALLQQAARSFRNRWAEILLWSETPRGRRLRPHAWHGFDGAGFVPAAGAGLFFERVVREAQPVFALDAANDPRIAQPYYRELDVKSVWAVPLAVERDGAREVLGVLAVGFDRIYECLPHERHLLLALAQRSSLAIERRQMADSLARNQARVIELTARLLEAQEEERRRISRDLHDETGQALMALRLYLENALRGRPGPAARGWLQRGLALVDSSAEELRRLLAQLSPQILDQLGLEAALRLELRRQKTLHGWKTHVRFRLAGARLPRPLETLLFRVAVEALHNIGRHAQARLVELTVEAGGGQIHLRVSDDGVGLPPQPNRGRRYGLAGMRERLRLAGGELRVRSAAGAGVTLEAVVPLLTAPAAPPPPAFPSPTFSEVPQ